jgi:hypothetical protein
MKLMKEELFVISISHFFGFHTPKIDVCMDLPATPVKMPSDVLSWISERFLMG